MSGRLSRTYRSIKLKVTDIKKPSTVVKTTIPYEKLYNGKMRRRENTLSGSATDQLPDPDSKVEILSNKNKPVIVQEVGNLTVLTIQHWITKDEAIQLFEDNEWRRGFNITNNGVATVYVGITDKVSLLKKTGTPIYPKGSFSSANFIGRVWCVADDGAGANSVDVRVWEEQL